MAGMKTKTAIYFYYENDKMFTNVIAEIEDEDGTHGYYFGDNGIMLRDSQEWISYWDKEKQEWITGYIWADEKRIFKTRLVRR